MSHKNWEAIYSKGQQLNAWPFSDLVSLFFTHKEQLKRNKKHEGPLKVLELGFGAGNHIDFFQSQGIEFNGIEISESAIDWATRAHPKLNSENFTLGSFVESSSYSGSYDAVIDRGSMTCCSNAEVSATLKEVQKVLRPGGLFFGVDWFSKNHSDFGLANTIIDSCTRTDFPKGQFKDTGKTHFVNREEILDTFRDFKVVSLTEKIVMNNYPNVESHQFASWSIVVEKP
jgi:SAM-dependent methyltransferase